MATPLLKTAAVDAIKDGIDNSPAGRLAEMEEIGDSISYMASPLSSFMYGAAMIVDGGYSIQ